jgi:hypothetical protein
MLSIFVSVLEGDLQRTTAPVPPPDANNDFGIALKGVKTGLKDILIINPLYLIFSDYIELVVLIRNGICLSLMY